jgi:hypothetical protein
VVHVVTSGCDNPLVVTKAVRGARCSTPNVTALRSVRRSRSLRSSSAMAHPGSGEGKQQDVHEDDKEKDEEMAFQDTKSALKAVYGHSDSDSSTDEHHK